jgi:2-polyprenyl-3-methyl-5-hydroxy-6-metoxy-1,4-benzoquinol methylase
MVCVVCGRQIGADVERATIRCNIRRFRDQLFNVWRCPHCRSIHAGDEVDLDAYYAAYPCHVRRQDLNWVLRAMHRRLLGRLRRAGLRSDHAILDYGCGNGTFVEFLRERGYEGAVGFDQYSERFRDRRALEARYDLVFSQDVIEHVDDPRAQLAEFDRLTRPGGLVAIGTPNAEDIDLGAPDLRVHALHQPYHRHILSKRVLLGLGDEMDWQLLRYYKTTYSNTLIPGVNTRFAMHYCRTLGDDVELGLEPFHIEDPRVWSPKSIWLAWFGFFFAPEIDVMAIYRVHPAMKQLPPTTNA